MKSIIYCITLLVSLSMAQTSTVNDRFAGFDPFVANIVVNIFNDMNIMTTDCQSQFVDGFVFAENANSSGVVCGSIGLGDAFGLFTSSWNRGFERHTENWEAMSPWDSANAGNTQVIMRGYTYIASSEVFSLSVIYLSDGTVIVATESIGYTP